MWAQRIVADQDALRGDISSMREGLSGVLRIGVIPTALAAVSLLTAPFAALHPQVRLSVESLSSREIVNRLADFNLEVGLTYVDGEPLGAVRTVPLYRERYLLLTAASGVFAERVSVGWAELVDTPMCLLSPVMQNRRILDRYCAEAGVELLPSVESDTVSALYAHVATHRWSTVIAHAWLHLFGVPDGMRVIPMEGPVRTHRIGLVLTEREPQPMLARALVDVAGRVDVSGALGELLARHLNG